jgi:hypothetical protein
MYEGFSYISTDGDLAVTTGSSKIIEFGQDTGGEPNWTMRIDGSGKVGIGTTEINSRLTVGGTIETSGGIKFADGTTQTTAGGGSLPSGSSGQTLYYNGGWTASSVITNTGTGVGIATNEATSATLDVNGNIRIRGSGTSLPSAGAAYRGVMYLLTAATGVSTPDKLYVCMKKSDDSYQWVLVSRGD